MFADAIKCTHSGTGGSGSLTLAVVAGFPQPTDFAGTSGSRIINYSIAEYTDSTKAALLQYERGRGVLNLATNSLTRTEVAVTWNGTTYNANNPSALTIGNTAANVEIIVGASASTQRPSLPAINSNTNLNEQYTPANTRISVDSNTSGFTMTAGRRCYIPCEFAYGKPISTIAVYATSVATTGNVRISVYEWGTDGMPGNLIKEFTSASQISISTAAGLKSVTLATPFCLPPGWYYFMVQSDAAVQLNAAVPAGHCGAGSSNNRDIMYFYKDTTYGVAPSSGETSYSGATSRSAGGQILVYVK